MGGAGFSEGPCNSKRLGGRDHAGIEIVLAVLGHPRFFAGEELLEAANELAIPCRNVGDDIFHGPRTANWLASRGRRDATDRRQESRHIAAKSLNQFVLSADRMRAIPC